MKIHFFGKSDIGRVRNTNEDYFSSKKINDNEHLFIIADGMGGHQAGEVASKLGTNIFIRNYQKSRKEGKEIEKSMLYSLKKANSSILKKALSDPQKRGMGTTFTALVLSDYKANITHVGDSRIYLVRNNKIRRITTDHTFVEKMLQEGKINEEEARDHPQKNILYMSLGARESYFPEIIKDIEIKKGDIITICSDGLNNMIEDEEIKKIALAYTPEKSVKELIKMANESGGTDNITIQIIQIGSAKSKKKEDKKKKYKLSTNKTLPLKMLFLFFSIFLLFNLNRIDLGLTGKNPNKFNILSTVQKSKLEGKRKLLNPTIIYIDTQKIPLKISPQNLIYFFEDILYLRHQEDIILLSIKKQYIKRIQLKKEDNFIPASLIFTSSKVKSLSSSNEISDENKVFPADTFIFQKKKYLEYQIYNYNKNEVLATIQSDPELNSIDHESRTIKFLNLKPPLIPIFMNHKAFIFHDQNHFYVIEYPIKENNRKIIFYKIFNLSYSKTGIISTKILDETIKILFFDTQKQTLEIFEIPSADYNTLRKLQYKFTEKPLNIEYYKEDSIIIYFSYGYIILKKNNSFIQNYYLYNDENLFIQKILIDFDRNKRILVDKQSRLFILKL